MENALSVITGILENHVNTYVLEIVESVKLRAGSAPCVRTHFMEDYAIIHVQKTVEIVTLTQESAQGVLMVGMENHVKLHAKEIVNDVTRIQGCARCVLAEHLENHVKILVLKNVALVISKQVHALCVTDPCIVCFVIKHVFRIVPDATFTQVSVQFAKMDFTARSVKSNVEKIATSVTCKLVNVLCVRRVDMETFVRRNVQKTASIVSVTL